MKKKSSIFNIDSLIIICALLSMFFLNPIVGNLIIIGFIVYKIIKHKDLLLAMKGSKAYKKLNYKQAIEFYEKAILSKNPKLNIIKSYIILEIKYGSIDKAEKNLSNIISNNKFSNKDCFDLNILKALIRWKKGGLDEAIYILETLKENGESSILYETLGYLLLAKKDYKKSLDLNLKALEYNHTPVISANLAETYYKLNNIEKSKDLFLKVLEQNVTFSEPYYYYGLILKKEGNFEDSKKFLEKAFSFEESFLSILTKKDIQNAIDSINSKKLDLAK